MRKTYFSLEEMPNRSDCERLMKEYKKGNVIGKGVYGKVFELCKDQNCNIVLKTMEFCKSIYELSGFSKPSFEEKYELWKKEIDNQLKIIECQKRSPFQFVPSVYDAWFCLEDNGDAVFYIVMEKFNGTLEEFVKKFKNYDKKNDFFKSFIRSKLQSLYYALNYINNTCKFCLNDIKLDNILYKKLSDNSFDFVFSDFGTSSYNIDLNQECIEKDLRRFKRYVEEFGKNLDFDDIKFE